MTGPQPNTQQNGAAQAPRAAQQMHVRSTYIAAMQGLSIQQIHVKIQTALLPVNVSLLQAPARQIEPSSEALAQLVSMGFEEQRAS